MAEVFLDDYNFESEVLMSDIPVLVDFWAPWCGPCRGFGPVVEAAAQKYEGRLKVCKYDCSESTEFAEKYGIENIPAVKFFKDGKVVNEFMGAVQLPELETYIASVL